MAKTLRQHLADLAGGKKTNVFYKGLNTDVDEHLIGNDQFSKAINVRINNKDGELGTLQNLKSNVLASSLSINVTTFDPTESYLSSGIPVNADRFWLESGHSFDTTSNKITHVKWTFSINADSANNLGAEDVDFIVAIGTGKGFFDVVTSQTMVGVNKISNDTFIKYCIDKMKSDTTFLSKINPFLQITTGSQSSNILFNTLTNQVIGNISISVSKDGTNYDSVSNSFGGGDEPAIANYNYLVSNTENINYPIGLVSFSGFIAAVCFISTGLNSVLKLNVKGGKSITFIEPLIYSDFGITNNYTPIKLEKVEENENYNRLYWTDGINPIKTININATPGSYSLFNSPEDFNLFSKSPLRPMSILTVEDGGNINCGSWSYCYRFLTSDGKFSVISPISNPIPLSSSTKNSTYESHIGGNIATSSGKSVTFSISNVEEVYTRIQIIGMQYLDNNGGAVFFIIKDETISGSVITLTHNGNETTTSITAAEILSKKNTWDVAQDIAVKDNRLLAANLKNTTGEIISDNTAFRVKAHKHLGAGSSSNFDTSPSNTGTNYTAHSDFHNSDLYNDILYSTPSTDISLHRYAEGKTNTTKLMFGASTPGYHGTDANGVYVTFKLKKFSLDKTPYWSKISENDVKFPQDSNDDGYTEPPYYGLNSKSGEDGHFDNYKNAIFANKYVGYMRDEIYRFGIQFYDKNGNQTFTYPIGDIRFPSIENDYRFLGTTAGTYTPTAGDGTNNPFKYILADSEGNGYILYPEFRVKLSDAVKKEISGFSIVRAERTDADKRIVAAGLLNNTLEYKSDVENLSMSNRVGLDKQNLFTQRTGQAAFDLSEEGELYTLDSPDAIFGVFSYTKTGTQNIKIASKFLCSPYPSTQKPSGGADTHLHLGNDSSEITWMRDSSTNTIFYAAPVAFDYNTQPLNTVRQLSFYSKYFCDDTASLALADSTKIAGYNKEIHYGQNLAPGEIVPSSLHSHTKDFINRALVYGNSTASSVSHINLNALSTNTNLIYHEKGGTVNGNTTVFLSLSDSLFFDMDTTDTQMNTPLVEENNYSACKPYGKIIRTLTASSGQYGGNSLTNFETTRWISTGASLHGTDISTTTGQEMILDVFGGDTYLNMFSLNKFHSVTYTTDDRFKIVQGVVFPVESSINIDMRQGEFFGKNRPNLQLEDSYDYNTSYSAKNNLKSFPAKDSTINIVSDFKNLVAASNVKIAGQTQDAFSKFDANENFEVNANYGEIKNITSFKDNVYCIQERATSVLSINSRALIESKDGSTISIQSALGTGKVIERNDYISTKHGSQHRINTKATDLGLYWYDNNNNAICQVNIKSPTQVIDLTSVKKCSNSITALSLINLKDNPLNLESNLTSEGGVDISYSPFLNELLFSFTYYDTEKKQITLAYNEDLEVFTGERSYATSINVSHEGYLYSVGFNGLNTLAEIISNKNKLYVHDGIESTTNIYNYFYGHSSSNPLVVFTNNEEVISLKVYDKISVNTQESVANGIFSKFVFNTNVDSSETLNLNTTDIDKVIAGKQIVPVFVSKRQKGNYLKIQLEQTENTSSQDFNLFSTTTYYRKNII